MAKISFSNSNLNNKNNLANVFLKQRLAQFDREQKYSIYHIERNKSSTNHFLTQIKQCDTFITTGSLETSGKCKEKQADEEEEDEVDNPQRIKSSKKHSKYSSPLKIPAHIIPTKQKNKAKNLSALRAEWMKEGTRKKLSDFERGEVFLAKLREKERYLASLQQTTSDEEEDYNPLLRNAKSGIARLPKFRKESHRPFSSGDKTKKPADGIAKRLDSTFDEEKGSVKFPRVSESGVGVPGVAWHDGDTPREDMMRVFLNMKIKMKPKPLHCRIDDFYGKLDEMKRQQDERMKSLPYYEKRRRWLLLTKGRDDEVEETEIIPM